MIVYFCLNGRKNCLYMHNLVLLRPASISCEMGKLMKQLLVIIYLYNLCTYEMQMLSEAFTLILLHRDSDGLGKCHKNFGFSLLWNVYHTWVMLCRISHILFTCDVIRCYVIISLSIKMDSCYCIVGRFVCETRVYIMLHSNNLLFFSKHLWRLTTW